MNKFVNSESLALDSITSLESNPHVVRDVAAATLKKKYEYPEKQNKKVGALTTAIISLMTPAIERGLSWQSVFTRACELVNSEFHDQHAHVEEPSDGIVFWPKRTTLTSFL